MMTPVLETKLDELEKSLQRAEREINEPVAYFPEAAKAIRIAAKNDSAELGHDLLAAQSLLGKVKVPLDGWDDIPHAQDLIDALRARIADAIKLAEDAGYQTHEEQSGSPDRLEIKRIDHAAQLDRLAATINELAEDVKSIRALQQGDTASSGQQRNLVQYFVERVEIKIALFELNLKEVVELLGLGEAVAGILRLVRSFVASVIPASIRATAWLKQKAEALKPVAGAISEGFKQLVNSVRSRITSAPPTMSQKEAEAEARRLILDGKPVPMAIAVLVRELHLSKEKGLASARLLTNLFNLDTLNLRETPVADISPLAALTNLQILSLSETPVADLLPLAALTNLQGLGLSRTPVTDVSPLASLTKLQILHIIATPVADVSPLSTLTNLQELNLGGTPVADVSPLAALTNLHSSQFLNQCRQIIGIG